ncbi:ABC transporter permease [Mucilaginibacter sp. AK015]|uniref:ABC transporter permease n=1 Tax=Mucilaginibacter sp. AK015 TaxID=2723072 RepID=UPI0016104813|nr:ABC transporter permease [Mucilaginibacter sp. AK015]MBB5395057.1 ABC-type antimicrobial peptide transport system permease subunit/AraC-like DNA-binding protein [Mucilaginibacter sp. AK015]
MLTLALLLVFARKQSPAAARWLSPALLVFSLHLAQLPLDFSLALGPLVYFFTRKTVRPEQPFRRLDWAHCGVALICPLVPGWMASIFILVYLYLSQRMIRRFYDELPPVWMDKPRLAFRQLETFLYVLAVSFLLGWFSDAFTLVTAAVLVIMAAQVILKPAVFSAIAQPKMIAGDLREKSRWLKQTVKERRLYEDPGLTLPSLAAKLSVPVHELSRIINLGLKKNFNDFINELRVQEVSRKMRQPAYEQLTLLGIAYESGFNSKTTFNRVFRELTGKSAAEYKSELDKQRPSYNAGLQQSPQPLSLRSVVKRNFMIRNYIKTAWRGLLRNKSQSIINISGLAVGLACGLLILLWVQNEYSTDAFFTGSERLFKVYKSDFYNQTETGSYEMPGILADELKRRYPDIQYATNMGFGETSTFQAGDKIVKMMGNSAGADFFNMFSYRLLAGTAQNALNSPSSIAISRKMAGIFYGSPEQALGQTIRYQNRKDFKVSAVFDDLPANSSQSFDFLLNWDAFLENNAWAKEMGNNGPHAYVMLRPQASAAAVNNKIARFFDLYWHIDRKTALAYTDLALQPYADAYLNNNIQSGKPEGGRIRYVHLFSITGIFILLIACVNFMNLMTARSVKRAKEVGVRKAIGALRPALISQFIWEALIVTALAVSLALPLLWLARPWFNGLVQKQVGLPFGNPLFWLQLLGITVITGLISGLYPALFLSGFKPVRVLKSTIKLDTGTLLLRKGLVVFQFILAVLLMTGTVIVSRQMRYMESKDLGYSRENVVYLPAEGELDAKYAVFKAGLLNQPGIQAVSRINMPPVDIYGSSAAVDWTGHDPKMNTLFTHATIGYDYFKTMKLTLLAGHEFRADHPADTSGYILNETAVKLIGYKDPVGKPFTWLGKKRMIVGVVKDFHFHSLHETVGPMVLAAGEDQHGGVILIRTQPGMTSTALAAIQQFSKQLNPAFPPVIYFTDQEYARLYQNDQVINSLADTFTILAIFISSLGLLGLVMFTTEQRFKEIGIRKVLGAGVNNLFILLSREFIVLIVIAIAVATPLAWYATNGFLQGFAYRAPLSWWMFAFSAGAIILIALMTVSFQIIKVALANPVKSLRSE